MREKENPKQSVVMKMERKREENEGERKKQMMVNEGERKS
jgi:hypothetical protein